MSLPRDLLEQAWHLARREPRRPRQASLRRAVSATYYALFHLLAGDGARILASGTGSPAIHGLLVRGFNHTEMRDISRTFAGGILPAHIAAAVGNQPILPQLRDVARLFVELQQARHGADYDVSQTFIRSEVEELIRRTEQVFLDWHQVRQEPVSRLYLVALFAMKRFRSS